MSAEGLIMADDIASCSSAPGSAPGSPKNRVKFLCSQGGRILPRPSDGLLKYVGGETRVISVPRDIKFSGLMKKLTSHIEEEMILKYQLLPEDLDALVSVRNDEDMRHMFNEHDLYESVGTPRLRSFLFPARPVLVENQVEAHAIEQRYIDAINGIVRSSTSGAKNHHPMSNLSSCHGPSLGISSACSSPQSPESCNTDGVAAGHDHNNSNNYHGKGGHMHRVQSSPSMCNLAGPQHSCPCGHNMYPQGQNYYLAARHPPHQGHYPSKPPIDPHKGPGPDRLISVRSVGRAEGSRYQVDYVAPQYQTGPSSKYNNRGNGCCTKCTTSHFDDQYGPSFDRRLERGSSLSPSPIPLSPRYSHVFAKPWENALGGDS